MADETLSPEDREERDSALDSALGGGRVDDRSVDRAEGLLVDAEHMGRPWARVTARSLIRSGLRRMLNERSKAQDVVLMPYRGVGVTTTKRLGVRRRVEEGRREHQLVLLHEMTWPELEDWLAMIETQIAAAFVNRAKASRLLALREQFPDTAGPTQACQRLGLTIEQFLERDVA